MDVNLFNALFPLKIQSLLEELRKQHSLSFLPILCFLYTSHTYLQKINYYNHFGRKPFGYLKPYVLHISIACF